MVNILSVAYVEDLLQDMRDYFAKNKVIRLLNVLKPGIKPAAKWQKKYVPLEYSYSTSRAPTWVNAVDFNNLITSIIGDFRWSVCELRKFEKGDYTLLHDALNEKGIALFLDFESVDEEHGGYTSFMNKSEEFARIVPEKNALTIINQDDLKSFTKYLNHYANNRVFLFGILVPK